MPSGIITGGSSGVGRAIAESLGKLACNVFLIGRSEAGLKETASLVAKAGGSAAYAIADVGNDADMTRAMEAYKAQYGEDIDFLVANAGTTTPRAPIEEIALEAFDQVMATNVRGVMISIQKVLPRMKKQDRGHIVIIGSIMGLRTMPNASAYCMSKHALEGLLGCTRHELQGTGVKCGIINPAAVDTPWWHRDHFGPNFEKPNVPMLAPESVADAVLYLMQQHATANVERIVLEPMQRPISISYG
eukprot:Clim_evm92s207 gene=Clim_evmTU92s207